MQYRKWDFCQIQLNYMDTEEQAGMKGYRLAEKLGVPLVIMEPVRGGALANFSEDLNAKFHALDEKASIASYALRYVGSLPNVKVILSGMSTMEQVEDNIKTFSPFRPLNIREEVAIANTAAALRARVQNGCTGCRCCMPCPHGVDIPGNFKLWNTYLMYQRYESVRFGWEGKAESEKPTSCVSCGKCMVNCPQKINIPWICRRCRKISTNAFGNKRREALGFTGTEAKKALEAEGVTFAAVSTSVEQKTSQKKGIAPMMEILAECPEFLQGAAVADQVIGKAAAFLLRKGGAKYLYAKIISEHALETLKDSGIAVSYGTKVPYIINRKKDGMCPMEQTVLSVTDVEEAYGKLREKLRELFGRN